MLRENQPGSSLCRQPLPGSSSNPHTCRRPGSRSEEHTSELQSLTNLVCRLLLEKKTKRRTLACDTGSESHRREPPDRAHPHSFLRIRTAPTQFSRGSSCEAAGDCQACNRCVE